MTEQRTLTLADFLLARIAEDEAVALTVSTTDGDVIGYEVCSEFWCLDVSGRRVLAECAAKRQIVELALGRPPYESEFYRIESDAIDALLRLLALPYADHPDYRQEWRP